MLKHQSVTCSLLSLRVLIYYRVSPLPLLKCPVNFYNDFVLTAFFFFFPSLLLALSHILFNFTQSPSPRPSPVCVTGFITAGSKHPTLLIVVLLYIQYPFIWLIIFHYSFTPNPCSAVLHLMLFSLSLSLIQHHPTSSPVAPEVTLGYPTLA